MTRSTVLCSVAAAVAVYVLMLLGYLQGWGWLARADAAALNASYDIGIEHPAWLRCWEVLTTVFGPDVFRFVGMVAAVAALVRRRWRAALFLLVAVETSGLLTQLAKDSVDRPRPVTAGGADMGGSRRGAGQEAAVRSRCWEGRAARSIGVSETGLRSTERTASSRARASSADRPQVNFAWRASTNTAAWVQP